MKVFFKSLNNPDGETSDILDREMKLARIKNLSNALMDLTFSEVSSKAGVYEIGSIILELSESLMQDFPIDEPESEANDEK
jgi:hypothetical protein